MKVSFKELKTGERAKIQKLRTWTERMDGLFLNRFLGIPLFLGMMYLMFFFATYVGGSFQSFFEMTSRTLFVDGLRQGLAYFSLPNWFLALMVDGVGQGIHITLSFIPVMTGMFLALSFLEASGYMARAAFVMDKIMQWVGLPGKSFVPLMIGFGCNVPAVMATRTLDTQGERLLTILMTPFMSCSARFSIYALFAATFFRDQGQNIIFGLYLIGILIAFATGLILRTVLRSKDRASLILELPPYRWPNLKMLWRRTWYNLSSFLLKAGSLIIILCSFFGVMTNSSSHVSDSHIAHIGKTLTPLFAPIGIEEDNWPATVGLVTGILAKEMVVGTLKALYSKEYTTQQMQQEQDDNTMVLRFGSTAAVISYLLFILLYFPCVSVVATMARELNKSWALFSVLWTTGIAYSVALLFYQTATIKDHPVSSLSWITAVGCLLGIGLWGMRKWAELKVQNRKIRTNKLIPTRIVTL